MWALQLIAAASALCITTTAQSRRESLNAPAPPDQASSALLDQQSKGKSCFVSFVFEMGFGYVSVIIVMVATDTDQIGAKLPARWCNLRQWS
jgi:hypothetical protein